MTFSNTDLLDAMSAAARAGRPGLETHPDYRRPAPPMTEGQMMEVAQRIDRARDRNRRIAEARPLSVLGVAVEATIARHHLAAPDPGTRFVPWGPADRRQALAEMREAYLEHVMTTDAADLA